MDLTQKRDELRTQLAATVEQAKRHAAEAQRLAGVASFLEGKIAMLTEQLEAAPES